ncbi:gamma-butyrobetaine dioxygenase-like [Branchiostoma lanceolatum]|uniref:gamma-butyrobetaine dioxygenase-like n=1 Tax=Branchiostoma lanceolatum TaxID=7740 RepID=UPI0034568748
MAIPLALWRPFQRTLASQSPFRISVLSGQRLKVGSNGPKSSIACRGEHTPPLQQGSHLLCRVGFPPQLVQARRSFSVLRRSSRLEEGPIMEKVCLNEAARVVEVEWSEGGVSMFPYVWLRDNCQCQQCFNPDSRARLFLMADLDVNLSPVTADVYAAGTMLTVDWPDGHHSQYDWSWLKGRCFSTQALEKRGRDWQRKTKLWGSELAHDLPKADFPTLLTDDRALYDFLFRLDSVGLVLVQNVPCEIGQLQRLANRVAFLRHTNYGKEFVVKSKPNPSNVAYTSAKLGLHTDLPQYNYAPGVQMLHCIEQCKGEGGDNHLVDGFNVAYQLKEENPEAFRLLTTLKVNFQDEGIDFHRFYLRERRPIISLDDKGNVENINYNDQVRDSILDLPTDQVQALYGALKAYNTIMYRPKNCVRHKMAAGEMIAFNNTRTLHGRLAYSQTGGTRHLQGGYLDWDEIYSRMRVLKTDLGIQD